jgi:hypothetical protein
MTTSDLADFEASFIGSGRRSATIIITAAKGYRRSAKGLVGRAIRQALKIRKWHTQPHMVSYVSESEIRGYGGQDSRFTLDVTDAEMKLVSEAIAVLAKAEGWSEPPTDSYHD